MLYTVLTSAQNLGVDELELQMEDEEPYRWNELQEEDAEPYRRDVLLRKGSTLLHDVGIENCAFQLTIVGWGESMGVRYFEQGLAVLCHCCQLNGSIFLAPVSCCVAVDETNRAY